MHPCLIGPWVTSDRSEYRYSPSSVRTRACMTSSWNWQTMVGIFSGTPKRASTDSNSRSQLTESCAFWRSIKHTYRGGFLARPSFCSRRTTNNVSTVGRAERKPHYLFLGEYSCVLPVVAEAGCDDFQQHFACVGHKRNPPVVVSIRIILLVKDVGGRIFPLLGEFSRSPHVGKHVVKAPDEFGVVDYQ